MPADMKKNIADTFVQMIRRGNIDKITVKALIEECHISRQTFYYHFQDIMDVLEWSTRQATQLLTEKSLQAEDMRSALQIFISFFVEQYPMLQKLINSQRRAQIEQILVDSVGTYLTKMAQAQQQNVSVNYADQDILLRYNACGLVGVLLAYGGKSDLDHNRLALQLEKILSGELSRWND